MDYENKEKLLERFTAIFGILSHINKKKRILGTLEPTKRLMKTGVDVLKSTELSYSFWWQDKV